MEPAGCFSRRREQRRPVAVRVRVDKGDRLVRRFGPHHREHGPEYLVPVDLHGRRHLVDDRGADEEPIFVAWHLDTPAVESQVGAGLLAPVDVAEDAVFGVERYHRAHFALFVAPRADPDPGPFVPQHPDQRVSSVADRHGG